MMESHRRDLERSQHHDIICVLKIQLYGAQMIKEALGETERPGGCCSGIRER